MLKHGKNIKSGRTKKRKKTFTSGWASNVLKSLGYTSYDVIAELMPNTIEMGQQISDTKDELADTLGIAKDKAKGLASSAKTEFDKIKNKDLKEAIEDIKSGNLYNKDRMNAALDSFASFGFGGDDDFGSFDASNEDFDSFNVESDNPNTNVMISSNIGEDNPMVQAQEITSATVAKGTEVLRRGNREDSIVVSSAITKTGVNITDQLQLLNSEVAKISSTLPKTIAEQAALTTRYYEESLGYQKNISDTITELKTLYVKSQTVVGADDKFHQTNFEKLKNGLDIGGYKDLIIKNAKNTANESMFGSFASMAIDMLKMQKEMGGDGKGLAAKGLTAIMKNIIPKGVKSASTKLDDFLKNLLLPVGMKISKLQDRWDDPFLQTIGKIFGISATPNMTRDKSEYEKGAVAFDGKVHRAITDVIPTYLRMIASAVTGKEEVAFDYDKGVYKTVSDIRKEFDDEVKRSVTRDFFNEKNDFGKFVDKIDNFDKNQRDNLKETFDDFLNNAVLSGKFVTFRKGKDGSDDIAKYTGLDKNDPTVQLIRNFFEGYIEAGRTNDLNNIFSSKMIQARDTAERTFKDMTKDALSHNYYVMDNGLDDGNGGMSPSIKNTKSLASDKYGRDQNSYLRDILGVLATGIKVVNVSTLQNNPQDILNYSNSILSDLDLDVQEYNTSQAGANSNNPTVASPISYDENQITELLKNVLTEAKDEDALDKVVNKLNNNNKFLREDNLIGKTLKRLQSNRNKINTTSDNVVNDISNRVIGMIYGNRPTANTDANATGFPTIEFIDDQQTGQPAGQGGDDYNSSTFNGFPYYSQNDTTIKNKSYELSSGKSDTMGKRGCGPTAMAMIASRLIGKDIDPITMANMAIDGGYSVAQGTLPQYFSNAASMFGINSKSVIPNKENIVAMLRSGIPIILQGQDDRDDSPFTSSGHYVVGVGIEGNNVIVNDPRGKEYSKKYSIDSILGGIQNVWGFSNGDIPLDESNTVFASGYGDYNGSRKKDRKTARLNRREERNNRENMVNSDTPIATITENQVELARNASRAIDGIVRVSDELNEAMFGEDGLIPQIEDTQLQNQNEENPTVSKAKEDIVEKAKRFVLGEEKDGVYSNGLLSDVANGAKSMKSEMKKFTHELIYGSEDGAQVGMVGYMRKFFGEDDQGKLNITGKVKEFGTEFKDHFKARAKEWTSMIFGEDEVSAQERLDTFMGDMKGKKGLIGAASVVGALGSFFLPGGPIGGALIGAGMGIVSQSTQLKDFLFGKEDPNDDGKRKDGLIPEKFQSFFTDNKKRLAIGAGVGLLGSFFLPGGPIGGALIGGALSIATKSKTFSNILYGENGDKEDPTGGIVGAINKFIKKNYSKDKNVKSTFLDAGMGAGVGLVGSFFLPGGPILGSLIGAGANIALNTDKFKNFFFGEEDPEDDGKRKGGVFGKYKDMIAEKAEEAKDRLSLWVEENITNPVKVSIDPIKERAKQFLFGQEDEDRNRKGGLMGAIADRVNNSAFGDLKKAIKENIIDKMKDGFKKIFGGFAKLLGFIVKSPVTALTAVAERINKKDNGENVPSIADRIAELNKKSREKFNTKTKKDKSSKESSEVSNKETDTTSTNSVEVVAEATEEVKDDTAKVANNTEAIKELTQTQIDKSERSIGILSRIENTLSNAFGTVRNRMGDNVNGENSEDNAPKVSIPTENTNSEKKIFKGKSATKDTSDISTDGEVSENGSPEVSTGLTSLINGNSSDSIGKNVERIAKSVDGQLNGTGYNLNRIYKLLRRRLGKDVGDDDGEDIPDGEFKGSIGRRIWSVIKNPRKIVDGVKGLAKNTIGKAFTSVKNYIVGGVKKVFSGVINAGKALLGVPKMIIGGVKKAIPAIGKALLGVPKMIIGGVKKAIPTIRKEITNVFNLGATLLGNGLRALGNVIENGAKGFGNLISGALTGFGQLAQGLGILGKEALTLLAKGGSAAIKRVANAGTTIAKGAAHAVTGLFNKMRKGKKGKDNGAIATHVIIDGGKLDYVDRVAKVGKLEKSSSGGGSESLNENATAKIIPFPEQSSGEISDDSAYASISGGASSIKNSLKSFVGNAKSKGSNLIARVKGSASSIREKFKREDSQEEQRTFREKLLELTKRNTEGSEKHHSVWSSIFSKKGLITAGLIFMAPLIIKATKGLINFFTGTGKKLFESLTNIIGEFGNRLSDEGGIVGALNNAGELATQVTDGVGLTKKESYVIDEETGAILTDDNGDPITKTASTAKGSLLNLLTPKKARVDHETGEVYESREFDHTTETLGTAVETAWKNKVVKKGKKVLRKYAKKKGLDKPRSTKEYASVAKTLYSNSKDKVSGAIKGVKSFGGKVANSKIGTKSVEVAKGVGSKVKNSKVVQNAVGAVKDSDIIKTATGFMKKALDFVVDKFGSLSKKFGSGSGSTSKIASMVKKLTSKIFDSDILKRFMPKISKIMGKVATAAGTLLTSDAVWITLGALGGATNPGELFEVDMDAVEEGKTKALMRAIAAVYKGIVNTAAGSWFDLICDIVQEISGFNLAKVIATNVFNLFSGEKGENDLSQAQAKFDEGYVDYVQEEYDAYKKNQEESGQEAMSFEEFRKSDLATSRADYNKEINPSLGKRVWDGVKKVGSGIGKSVKSAFKPFVTAKNDLFSHKETGWFDVDGSYYVKSSASTKKAEFYNYYNVNGDLIDVVPAEEVDKKIKAGQLSQSEVKVKSNISTNTKAFGIISKKVWDEGTSKAKELWGKAKEKINNLGEKVANNPITKFLLPSRKTALATPDGNYYMVGSNGYNYYNANGTMIATNIPEDVVTEMLESGQLVETEKLAPSGAKTKITELINIGSTTITDMIDLGKETFNALKDTLKEGSKYWTDNIKEHGVLGAVKNFFVKKRDVALYDVKGGYYVQNKDGTYNYFNINGDLISENVPQEDINEMMSQGLLTEGEIVEDSDAKNAIGRIQSKVKDLWQKAKEKGTNAIDNLMGWLGLKDTKTTKSGESANASSTSAGKGDDRVEATSKSGIVNGFPYYSQNDPSIKDKPYNLSNGKSDTIGERGCGPIAMSMVASQLTGTPIDPTKMANFATTGGYSIEEGTTPDYFGNAAASLGLSSEAATPTKESIRAMLSSGKPIILQGQDTREGSPFTSQGHYVVGVGMNGDNIIVNDPRGRKYSREYNIDSILSGAQNMWGFSNNGISLDGSVISGFGGYGTGVDGDVLNGFPYLLQNDDRWGSTMYSSTNDKSQTIGSSACGPTSMAMVLRSFGNNVTPVDTAQYSLDNGFRTANSGTSWGYFQSIGSKYGLTTNSLGSTNSIINELKNGNPVIASMGPRTFTKGGHYIVLSGISENGQIYVNDPASVSRSNVTYDPSIFAKEGKKFWSFSKDGTGSINNIADVKRIDPTVSTTLGSNANTAITEGTPEAGTISNQNAEIADTSIADSTASESATASSTTGESKESTENKSVLELLLGGIEAFTKPIVDWMTGGVNDTTDSDKESEDAEVASSAITGASIGATFGANSAPWLSSSSSATTYKGSLAGANIGANAGASASVRLPANGDYLGKYTEQFESGGRGPETISTGVGDNGGVSFGTYQFATYNKPVVDSSSPLATFWNMYYASKHPDVYPGNNDAFKAAWVEEATADPTTFKAREAAFFGSNNYMSQVNALSDIVDVAKYDRGFQEQVFATSIQYGKDTGVLRNALSGKNVMGMSPRDTINTVEDYKAATIDRYFTKCSDNVKRGLLNRFDNTERNQMLALANNPPVKPLSEALKTENNGSAIAGKGGDDTIRIGSSGTMDRAMNVSKSIEQRNSVSMIDNPLFAKMVDLLGRIVNNTSSMGDGIKELCGKDFGTTETRVISGGTHNNIIPVPQSESNRTDSAVESQYSTAKRISAGLYLS